MVVGNEVLDAMPVQLLTWTGERWLERGVALAPESTPEVPQFTWADRPLPEGSRPPTEHPDAAYAPGTEAEVEGAAWCRQWLLQVLQPSATA